jgi:triacylglycerol lipase
MNNIWFPVPVSLFFRRVVNVISTLSITHHYLLRQRSTDGNGTEVPSRLASRVLEAGRHVPWTTIVENSLDGILQGVCMLFCHTISRVSAPLLTRIASGKLYIPWFRWPARLSLFHPDVQQFDDGTSAKNNHLGSNPNCDPRPQGPTEPADPGRDNREDDEIHRLMQNPVLYDPLRAPRYPIVLCHGAPPCTMFVGRHSI